MGRGGRADGVNTPPCFTHPPLGPPRQPTHKCTCILACGFDAAPQVISLTTALGVLEGTNSPLFAIALVFSLIVMYDATGVRLHAGKQASVLNMIITELPPDHPVSSSTGQLKDSLGHTPLQVAVGAVVGVVTGYIVGLLYDM
jgi:acid phosphatase family membrane protein YuiD